MLPDKHMNATQAGIVRLLYAHERLRFTELNADDLPSDQFSYHLRQLTKAGIIAKDTESRYRLTLVGKTQAPLLSIHTDRFIHQGFIAVRVVLTKEEEAGQTRFLLQKRATVPYRGSLAVPGGKVLYGDGLDKAARWYMQYQTGLDCQVEQRGFVHHIDEYENQVVQDKYFCVLRATNPKGDLMSKGPKGANTWLTYEEIREAPDAIHGLLSIIDMAMGRSSTFEEKRFKVNTF